MNASSKIPHIRWVIAATWGVSVFSGCFNSGPALSEVHGKVMSAGKPVAGVSVEYQPLDSKTASSVGYTDQDGNFRLRFTRDRYGAAPGQHQVKLYIDPESGSDTPPQFRLPDKYSKKSEIKVNVPGLESEHIFDVELEPLNRNANRRTKQVAIR